MAGGWLVWWAFGLASVTRGYATYALQTCSFSFGMAVPTWQLSIVNKLDFVTLMGKMDGCRERMKVGGSVTMSSQQKTSRKTNS